MKCFSFSDIGIAIMSDVSLCNDFSFIIKDQALNILKKVNTK